MKTIVRFLSRADEAQATAEYALVLVGAAAVALVLVAWATNGGGVDKIGHLLGKVVDAVAKRVS